MDALNSVNDMLIACVRAIGKYEAEKNGFVAEKNKPAGSKFVAAKLWPERDVLQAQQLLLNSLNPDRAEKLSPDQAFYIERLARERGCHIAIEFRCDELSYQRTVPIVPENKKEQLMLDFINAQKTLAVIAEKIGEINE